MRIPKVGRSDYWVAALLAVATVVTIGLQLANADSEPTPLESALFSVLQFVFSLGFAWTLARVASHREFRDNQKQFAIAAYRRIKEIDRAIDRVIGRISAHMKDADPATCVELDVIREISRGIKESIISSTADWGDIIGDEIEAVERIEALRRAEWESRDDSPPDDTASPTREPKRKSPPAGDEIKALVKSLPPSLRIISEEKTEVNDARAECRRLLQSEYNENGYLTIRGFSDPETERDIFELKEGDKLTVSISDFGDRVASAIARDAKGKVVGIMLNKGYGRLGYQEFFIELARFLGRSTFEIEIVDIARDADANRERHHFTSRIVDPPRRFERISVGVPRHAGGTRRR